MPMDITMPPDFSAPKPMLPRLDTSNAWFDADPLEEESLEARLVWAVGDVLGIDASAIQMVDSFSDLGGDHRTALALRRKCKGLGLEVKTKDILGCFTLAELQTCITPCGRTLSRTPSTDSLRVNPLRLRTESPQSLKSVYTTHTMHTTHHSRQFSSSTGPSLPSPRHAVDAETYLNSTELVSGAVIVKPRAGFFDGKVVAFVSLRALEIPGSPVSEIEVIPQTRMFLAGTQIASVRQGLEAAVAPTDAPDVWIVVRNIPVNGAGEMDKRKLRTWIQNVNEETYQQIMTLDTDEPLQQPESEMEKSLQKAVSRALQTPLEHVGMNFSFAQLGGDEVGAMQVVARSKVESIYLNSSEVLQNNTLAQLASIASTRGALTQKWEGETSEGDCFDLAPMQHLYFQTAMGGDPEFRADRDGSYRFNQSLLLKIKRSFTLDDVSAAVDAVVGHHQMLRTRFSRTDSRTGWTQRIVPSGGDAYTMRSHTISTDAELESIIERAQASIDIENGPVFAVDLVQTVDGHQMVYLIAHHLVVDLLSWRVIIQDLDELLESGSLLSQRSMPFRKWNELQKREVESAEVTSPLPTGTAPGNYAYWGLHDAPNTYEDVIEVGFSLSQELTTIMQTTCNRVFRTDSADVYLAALLLSFAQTFHDRPAPVVWNQEHGRDSNDPTVDIADTVGWFTTLSPVGPLTQLQGGDVEDFVDVLRRLKDMRRASPGRGARYFASKFFKTGGPDLFAEDWPFELIFSYAGSLQKLERENGVLEQLTIPGRTLASGTSDIGPCVGRIALFEVNAMVAEDAAVIKLLYNRRSAHQDRIAQWVQNFEHLLLEAIGRLRYHAQELTIADVPHLDVTYAGLELLNRDRLEELNLSSVRDIEAVYPVTAIQQAILVQQASTPESSQLHAIYEFASATGDVVDTLQLCTAWQNVTIKHTALRTVFVDSVTETGVYDQVILRRVSPSMLFFDVQPGEDPIEALNILPLIAAGCSPGQPHHRLAVCKTPTKTLVKLDISEALCDAQSMNVLFIDLRRAYATNKPLPDPTGLTYPDYLSFLESARTSESLDYWVERLAGVEPCTFPRLALTQNERRRYDNAHFDLEIDTHHIVDFARSRQVSPDAVLRLAWGLVLRAFVGSDKVCFGYRATGREAASGGPSMRNAVGCFGNTVVCSLDLSPEQSMAAVLKAVDEQYSASLRHQHVSIPELHHVLGMRGHERFFNTCISLTNEPAELNSRYTTRTNFELRGISHRETSCFDLAINARFVGGKLVVDVGNNSLLSEREAFNVANTLSKAVRAVLDSPGGPVESVDLFTDHDYAQIVAWANERGTPQPNVAVLHELVAKHVRENPTAPAVCAWDGDLTYHQLDDLAARLAVRLADVGVSPRAVVPVVLEKSVWSPVAMLAVLKAGAAFVPIDASDMGLVQPIFEQLNNKVAIVCENASGVLGTLFETVIVLNAELMAQLQQQPQPPVTPPQQAEDAAEAAQEEIACVFFTPASSREVRGIAFTHHALSTALLTQGPAARISSQSRVMQLSSFNVDIALSEVFTTLIHGGCVCVPTDSERVLDFTGAVQRMEVSWSYMTPLLARKLNVDLLPSLKTICFRTRALDEDSYAPWATRKSVLFSYGAPDVCPLGISFLEVFGAHQLNRIGGPLAGNFWIVNPEDHRKLMPIGAIGELVVEGPTLGCAYYRGQVDQTYWNAAAFTTANPNRKTKYFKTGHRVRYTEGGFMQLISSKREDLEIGGKVIVLSDIEQHIRRCLGQGIDVMVEAIAFKGTKAAPVLAAFVELGSMFEGPEDLHALSAATRERVYTAKRLAETGMRNTVPQHMIPQIFIPVKHLPVTPSLKVNRRKLQKMIHGLSREQLLALSTVPNPADVQGTTGTPGGNNLLKPLPPTQTEERMRHIWATVLGVEDETTISAGDGFIKAGGDDILAAELLVRCRREGITVSIADILRNTTLTDLCRSMSAVDDLHMQAEPQPQPAPVQPQQQQQPQPQPQAQQQFSQTVQQPQYAHTSLPTQQAMPTMPTTPPPHVSAPAAYTTPVHQITPAAAATPRTPNSVSQHGSSHHSSGSNFGSDSGLELVLASKVGADRKEIKDVAEASAMQARYIESGMLRGRANINYFIFCFSGSVNNKKLEEACQMLVTIHPILRTAFVPHNRKVFQVILKSFAVDFKRYLCPSWRLAAFTEKVVKKDQAASVAFSSPMTKFILLDGGKQSTLVLRLSKAQYDDLSVALLVKDLKKLYDGTQNPPRRPTYTEFVRCTQIANSRGAEEYWRSLLDGAQVTSVVQHSKPYQLTNHVKTIRQRVPVGSLSHLGISLETVIKAGWAMALATLSGSNDVVFGELVDGRQIRLHGGQSVTGVLGPTANTIPVRVRFPDAQQLSPLSLLQYVHGQRMASIPYENFGVLDLVERCTGWPYWTRFSTVVQHQYEETTVVASEPKVFHLGSSGTSCKFSIVESRAQDVPDMFVHSMTRSAAGPGETELCITFCENRIPVSFAEETLRMLVANVSFLTSVSVMQPVVPSGDHYKALRPQIPLPQVPTTLLMSSPIMSPGASGLDGQQAGSGSQQLTADQNAAIHNTISKAWASASLDPSTLGVPDSQRKNAAFYDLWGSLVPAAQLAALLTRDVPRLATSPGIAVDPGFAISMEEVIENPTMGRQFDLVARKLANDRHVQHAHSQSHGSNHGSTGQTTAHQQQHLQASTMVAAAAAMAVSHSQGSHGAGPKTPRSSDHNSKDSKDKDKDKEKEGHKTTLSASAMKNIIASPTAAAGRRAGKAVSKLADRIKIGGRSETSSHGSSGIRLQVSSPRLTGTSNAMAAVLSPRLAQALGPDPFAPAPATAPTSTSTTPMPPPPPPPPASAPGMVATVTSPVTALPSLGPAFVPTPAPADQQQQLHPALRHQHNGSGTEVTLPQFVPLPVLPMLHVNDDVELEIQFEQALGEIDERLDGTPSSGMMMRGAVAVPPAPTDSSETITAIAPASSSVNVGTGSVPLSRNGSSNNSTAAGMESMTDGSSAASSASRDGDGDDRQVLLFHPGRLSGATSIASPLHQQPPHHQYHLFPTIQQSPPQPQQQPEPDLPILQQHVYKPQRPLSRTQKRFQKEQQRKQQQQKEQQQVAQQQFKEQQLKEQQEQEEQQKEQKKKDKLQLQKEQQQQKQLPEPPRRQQLKKAVEDPPTPIKEIERFGYRYEDMEAVTTPPSGTSTPGIGVAALLDDLVSPISPPSATNKRFFSPRGDASLVTPIVSSRHNRGYFSSTTARIPEEHRSVSASAVPTLATAGAGPPKFNLF